MHSSMHTIKSIWTLTHPNHMNLILRQWALICCLHHSRMDFHQALQPAGYGDFIPLSDVQCWCCAHSRSTSSAQRWRAGLRRWLCAGQWHTSGTNWEHGDFILWNRKGPKKLGALYCLKYCVLAFQTSVQDTFKCGRLSKACNYFLSLLVSESLVTTSFVSPSHNNYYLIMKQWSWQLVMPMSNCYFKTITTCFH